MKRRIWIWIIAVVAYVAFDIAMWFVASVLGFGARGQWIAFAILALLGLCVTGVVVWYLLRRSPAAGPQDDEIEQLLAAARRYLAEAPATRGKSLSTLPAVVVLGPSGSAKTTTIIRSPVDAALLAGQAKRADDSAPPATTLANIWYAAGALIVEAGGSLLGDKSRWATFVSRLPAARGLRALFRGVQAPRVAMVCVGCDDLVGPRAAEALASDAAPLHAALSQLASTLGVRLPVYVVFTKADQIHGFEDTAAAFSRDEVRAVLGATLSIESDAVGGTYAERQSQRLTDSFARLYTSLAQNRLRALSGARDVAQRARAYEFAREVRKLTPNAVQFLVELCRPNPLRASPFLRGFYFVGVRPVVDETAGMDAPSKADVAAPRTIGGGATQVLSGAATASPAVRQAMYAPAAGREGTRRRPQWVFLDRLLPEVVLADHAALTLTTAGKRVDVLRRSVLAGLGVVALFLLIVTTISFAANRRLRDRAVSLMAAVAPLSAAPSDASPRAALVRLDSMRAEVERLDSYGEQGPPLHLRWGLYTGSALAAPARRAYFDAFDRVLLTPARNALVRQLAGLSGAAAAPALYDSAYNALESYLIVTDYPDSSTTAAAPPLVAAWAAGRTADTNDLALATAQFVYFTSVLPKFKPYSIKSDARVVDGARAYLDQFGSSARVYKVMVDAVSKTTKPVSLNRDYPGTSQVVVAPYEVPGAYTRDGWAKMQSELSRIGKYATAAQWVTGERRLSRHEQDSIATAVKQLYTNDYATQWRTYLRSGRVVAGGSLRDAGQRVQSLAGPGSPLLRFFALASANTSVDTANVGRIFQPVRFVVSASAGDQLIQPTNQPYMQALLKLGSAATAAADGGGADDQVKAVQDASKAVSDAAGQLAQGFVVDPEGVVDRSVRSLLASPATLFSGAFQDTKRVASRADEFCQSFQSLATHYPFSATGSDASVGDVSDVFRPSDGALTKLVQGPLKDLVIRRGSTFVAKPDALPRVSDRFLAFLNRLGAISQALYGDNRSEPSFTISVRAQASHDVPQLSLAVDDQMGHWSVGEDQAHDFTWNLANTRRATLIATYGSARTSSDGVGPWGLLHLFAEDGTSRQRQANTDIYEWQIGGAGGLRSGAPRFAIDVDRGRSILSRELFDNLQQCPSLTDR